MIPIDHYTRIEKYNPVDVDMDKLNVSKRKVEALAPQVNKAWDYSSTGEYIAMCSSIPILLLGFATSPLVSKSSFFENSDYLYALFFWATVLSCFLIMWGILKIRKHLIDRCYEANAIAIYHNLTTSNLQMYYDYTVRIMNNGNVRLNSWTVYRNLVSSNMGYTYHSGNKRSLEKLRVISPVVFKQFKYVMYAHSIGMFDEKQKIPYGNYSSIYDLLENIDKKHKS